MKEERNVDDQPADAELDQQDPAADEADEAGEEAEPEAEVGAALVIGAGVSGIRAALDLAEAGYLVTLTERAPAIGGILAKLDYQFPTDHCGMCKMLPVVGREAGSEHCMRKGLFHDNIRILPFTEVQELSGDPGAYRARLRRRARYVDPDVCVGTGKCVAVCPVDVADEFNQGLTSRKAIFRPVPNNAANNYVIDAEACTRCGECVEVCPVGAIDLEARDEELTVEVDAVVIATGSGIYRPTDLDRRNYSSSPDVVTALEFERLVSGTGCYEAGFIPRPSDGRPARKIAWLQCVGSRNPKEGRDYCSSICCMFALKEAVLAHEKGGQGIETTIFYIDLRTFGKGFHRYQEQAVAEHGVELVRTRVHSVEPAPDGTLRIRHLTPSGDRWEDRRFDLVVLSTGQVPQQATSELARMVGVEPDPHGHFPRAGGVEKVKSAKAGVYLCGSIAGLTDISDALVSGSSAAGEAAKLLARLGRRPTDPAEELPLKPCRREVAKVQLVLCGYRKAGGGQGGVDLSAVAGAIGARQGLVAIDVIEDLSGDQGLEQVQELLAASEANRVLFGGVLPLGRRRQLTRLAREAGFSPQLTDLIELREAIDEQAAVNGNRMARIVGKLTVAIERIKASEMLAARTVPMTRRALVVGGGVAGLRAALSLADRGIPVDLVERADRLGGWARERVHYTLDHLSPPALIGDFARQAEAHELIEVHLRSEVIESEGQIGGFTTRILRRGAEQGEARGEQEKITIEHGAAIIATGGTEALTDLYGHQQSDRILTQSEVEGGIASGELDARGWGTVVMIQCVGSRETGAGLHDYCSRICCSAALKNAFKIREINPDARIVILYRDLMTYGFLEEHFTAARKAGIIFARYDRQRKPEVELRDGRPVVRFVDQVLQQPVEVAADLLALSTGVEPAAKNAAVGKAFDVPLDPDGFFQEAESKWRPVDFLRNGIFLAGTAHAPAPMVDVVAQAEAAAQRAYTYLSKDALAAPMATSTVHQANCARCQTCVSVCPFDARHHDAVRDQIVVDPASCQGCGLCAAACPNNAAAMLGMCEKRTLAEIDALLE